MLPQPMLIQTFKRPSTPIKRTALTLVQQASCEEDEEDMFCYLQSRAMAALARVKQFDYLEDGSKNRPALRPALRLKPPRQERVGLRVSFVEGTIFTPKVSYGHFFSEKTTTITVT